MSNKTNDQVILEQIIREKSQENGSDLTFSEYFEIYTATEILKNYDVSYDDIYEGIVGNGGDGGIDSIYLFVNGELIKEDTELNFQQRKASIELFLIQSKTSFKFGESAIIKFKETADDLFNLSNNPDNYLARYNEELINKIKIFRSIYEKFARTFPNLVINYYYASQGSEIHPNTSDKVSKLTDLTKGLFGGSECHFHFLGSKELLAMTRNVPISSRILEVSETPISTVAGSYVCLATLSKYYEFISDNGALSRSIFESNVRDYQGSVTVNTGIRQTLQNDMSEDFWYLNNGVTIITPKAVTSGKQVTIEDPQIVNGLQTSYEIYNHFSELEKKADARAILVRIVKVADEEARDRIIRATNSQTSIPPASLRSSDTIHRNIEDYLKVNKYYYDRKKNFYKNAGMPINKIVSIPYMAQAVMAIILLKPNSARARPSTLLSSENDYKRIFSLEYTIDVYLKVLQIMKTVENYLKPSVCDVDLEKKEINNIKYYVAMCVGISICGSKKDMEKNLSILPSVQVSNETMKTCLKNALEKYNSLGVQTKSQKDPIWLLHCLTILNSICLYSKPLILSDLYLVLNFAPKNSEKPDLQAFHCLPPCFRLFFALSTPPFSIMEISILHIFE